MQKSRLAIAALLCTLPVATAVAQDAAHVHPDHHERVIGQASELEPWCREQTRARYVARGEQVYQWTSRYSDRGQVLQVEGSLRVADRRVRAVCTIARGARERHASLTLEDPAS